MLCRNVDNVFFLAHVQSSRNKFLSLLETVKRWIEIRKRVEKHGDIVLFINNNSSSRATNLYTHTKKCTHNSHFYIFYIRSFCKFDLLYISFLINSIVINIRLFEQTLQRF